jgi:hypothetical protein
LQREAGANYVAIVVVVVVDGASVDKEGQSFSRARAF